MVNERPRAKIDKKFDEFCRAVYSGKAKCTRMKVPLTLVKPYDIDHCLNYPIEIIKLYARNIQKGIRFYLAVYWNGDNFIMNDDYSYYLAYRSLDFDEVYIAVMGEFPVEVGEIIRSGGHELMPPLGLLRIPDDNDCIFSKNAFLDLRLQEVKEEFKQSSNKISLFSYFVTLVF